MDNRLSFRTKVLEALGANPPEVAELLCYDDNHFDFASADLSQFPLPDESFAAIWCSYELRVREAGFPVLGDYLPQLRFPIAAGISHTSDYQAATKRGADPAALATATGLRLRSPENLRVELHPTPAGHIPLIIAAERDDFVDLVRAFTRRNEPDEIPNSMGACMVAGYPDWHRIRLLRKQYEANGGTCWREEFERIKPLRDLYQDRFIILSSGPYSGVSAGDLGLDDQEWRHLSLIIRREHECMHYFTRRVLGSMRTNLLDELIADYFGIKAAAGNFCSEWLLKFLGLEAFPHYRHHGRLENYRGALSDPAFGILQHLVAKAIENLENFDRQKRRGPTPLTEKLAALLTLSSLTLEEFAAPAGPDILANNYAHWLNVFIKGTTFVLRGRPSRLPVENATAVTQSKTV